MRALPSPQGEGGEDDVVVVVIDAQYPNKGEAGIVVAEATGEDGEGGALVVLTRTMDASAAGKGKGGVVGQDGKNGGYGQAMGLEYGASSRGRGWPQVGQRNNGSNTPHSIFECGSAAEISERTEKEEEVRFISPLAFAAIPHSSSVAIVARST